MGAPMETEITKKTGGVVNQEKFGCPDKTDTLQDQNERVCVHTVWCDD